ncbi:hypothetical protein MMC27_005294 [Xylographa pallens]|nr:hypothetical protein [Xylographa pallens]
MRTPQRSAGLWLSMWCMLHSLGTFATAQSSENIAISSPPVVAATTEHLTLLETVAVTVPEIMVTKTVVSPITITQTIMNLETVTATMAVTQQVTDLKTVTSTMAVTELVTSLKNVTATMPVIQLVTDVKTVTATSVVNQVQMVTVTIPGTCTLTVSSQSIVAHCVQLTRAVIFPGYGHDEQNYNNNTDYFCHVNKGHEHYINDYDQIILCILSYASSYRANSNISLSPPRNWHITGKRSLNDGNDNDNNGSAYDDNNDDESYLGNISNVLNFDHYQIGEHYYYYDYHVKTHDHNLYDIYNDQADDHNVDDIFYNDQADDNDFNDDLDIDKSNDNNLNDDLDIDETNDYINDDYLNNNTFNLY